MNLTEIIAELPTLSIADRQFLIRQALDLDNPPLPAEDEAEIEKRLEDHRRDPGSTMSLDAMKARTRVLFSELLGESGSAPSAIQQT